MKHPFCLCFGVYNPVLHAKGDNFKPVVGAQTRNLFHAQRIFAIKGIGWGWEGMSKSIIKGNIYEKILFQVVLNEVLKSSKMTSVDVKTDVYKTIRTKRPGDCTVL